ncbi:hypothetical protein C0J52_02236 [Blattella germanica]|nr:hypothetical protein C0J52_02236 [Blattella germanica]
MYTNDCARFALNILRQLLQCPLELLLEFYIFLQNWTRNLGIVPLAPIRSPNTVMLPLIYISFK